MIALNHILSELFFTRYHTFLMNKKQNVRTRALHQAAPHDFLKTLTVSLWNQRQDGALKNF